MTVADMLPLKFLLGKFILVGLVGTMVTRDRARLAYKVARHPDRAALRLLLRARRARRDPARERARFFAFVAEHFGADGRALHEEYRQSAFARSHQARFATLRRWKTSYRMGTTSGFGCELLYVLVRAMRPRVVVDTGVLYGSSSAHVLAALERNDEGTLHSIDLGVGPKEPPNDFFIPADLKHRWELIVGDSREELPRLLARLGRVNLFHHDSLHTFEHMMWEYATALPYLTPGGVLSSDDVLISHSVREIFRTNAFVAFCEAHGLVYDLFDNNGLALCGAGPAPSAEVEVARTP